MKLAMPALLFALIRNGLAMGQHYHRARRENRKPALTPRSRYNRSVLSDSVSSTAPDRSPWRMQTMPGKSLATSLKRKRRTLNDMHFSNVLRLRFRLVSPVPADSGGKSGAPIQRCSIKASNRTARGRASLSAPSPLTNPRPVDGSLPSGVCRVTSRKSLRPWLQPSFDQPIDLTY